jgi:RimJ/RimL family protein N-acetyltransferase
LVWQWIQPFRERVSDDFAPRTVDGFVDLMLASAEAAETFAVWRGDDLGGLITIQRATPYLALSHIVFRRSFWGAATTLPAIREVYRRVFEGGAGKICATVFERNHALRSLARKIGAREEGLRRGQTLQDGKPADMVELGLLKEDFYAYWNSGRDSDLGSADGGLERSRLAAEPQQDGQLLEHADVHAAAIADAAGSVRHDHDAVEEPALARSAQDRGDLRSQSDL